MPRQAKSQAGTPAVKKKKKQRPGPKAKAGPHPKLNQRMSERICKILRCGAYLESAAAAVGINRMTLRAWLKRGSKEIAHPTTDKREQMFANFVRKVRRAISEGELRSLDRIDKAGQRGDWKADAWKLEHGPRKQLYRVMSTHKHEHTGKGGQPIQQQHLHGYIDIDDLNLPLEDRKKILRAMREQGKREVPLIESTAKVIENQEESE
jgi:hypothetical protein